MDTTSKPKQNTSSNGKFSKPAFQGKRNDGDNRRSRPSFERPKPEFDQKMVSIRRVTRVVAGGRRMTFAVAIAIGDKKGISWSWNRKRRRYSYRYCKSSPSSKEKYVQD